jgi:DNA-3-methyladenine glycosylase (3mg)
MTRMSGEPPPVSWRPLDRSFFARRPVEVAPELLGRVLVHDSPGGRVAVRLTEVEAYGVPGEDPASHTYRGRTRRNAVMFGPPGHLYVYFTYGMHFCANFVCMPEGTGAGVLLRAGEVIEGAELATARRNGRRAAPGGPADTGTGEDPAGGSRPRRPAGLVAPRDLARGPARLAVALGFAREHDGVDCCGDGPVRVLEGAPVDPARVRTGPRVGVANGKDTPWRFWIDGDPTVSPYRPHQPRSR